MKGDVITIKLLGIHFNEKYNKTLLMDLMEEPSKLTDKPNRKKDNKYKQATHRPNKLTYKIWWRVPPHQAIKGNRRRRWKMKNTDNSQWPWERSRDKCSLTAVLEDLYGPADPGRPFTNSRPKYGIHTTWSVSSTCRTWLTAQIQRTDMSTTP